MNSGEFLDDNRVRLVSGYALQQRLGSGSFAVVYKGSRISQTTDNELSGPENVAVKVISRTSDKLTKKVLQNLEIEISILRSYRHHNIVCMHDVKKTERHFYLLLEYCAGGDVQGLLRSRKAGRLSEILTRRLIRDLKAGLKFLWGQELIHRDIKPQNLLLTGPLPLDEVDDPEKTPELEEERRNSNFPTSQFALKIADFGFARHLQSSSLAETLCGSPIYMAPEILQHQRYDAKADLWSVGTVLFEMISGKPPFHGENHIDLLRNIQRKAVRLPPDVRVSKECVNLLRLLLNRNPLSRAGFTEFFKACDDFSELGCRGVPTEDSGTCRPASRDLSTIPEIEGDAGVQNCSHSLVTVTTSPYEISPRYQDLARVSNPTDPTVVTPILAPAPAPPTSSGQTWLPQRNHPMLQPLVPSPPCTANIYDPLCARNPPIFDLSAPVSTLMDGQVQMVDTSRRSDNQTLHNSTGDNSFVMVEHGTCLNNAHGTSISPCPISTYPLVSTPQLEHKQTASPGLFFRNAPFLGSRGDYVKVKQGKGMLSTSPGTGGALMGLISGGRMRLAQQGDGVKEAETRLFDAAKVLATAEDVGRRAISVAHVGDNRAYLAMKQMIANENNFSFLSISATDSIRDDSNKKGEHDSGAVTDDSGATEIMTGSRRDRGSSCDKSMPDVIQDESEEMPFAVQAESPPLITTAIPTRAKSNKSSSCVGNTVADLPKTSPSLIQSFFREALLCYMKALGMLKNSVGAFTKVKKDLESLQSSIMTGDLVNQVQKTRTRCGVISTWLNEQFRGVLERAEATNMELSKRGNCANRAGTSTVAVEELIYNHAMSCGREGAVKQLLGQYEAARASYRSAGLLVETLLMEPRIEGQDRTLLEEYVDGFATRINELDQVMLQQSRLSVAASATGGSQQRGPSVISLVGHSPFDRFAFS